MTRDWCGFIFAVLVIVGFPSIGTAQEIAPFRIYGIDGYAALRYLFEEDFSRRKPGEVESQWRRPVFEEELYILTHSYIYHPNFLKLDLGGGPLFAQETFESDGYRMYSSDTFYNATLRLRFLENKPYPLILYYDRSYPRVPLGRAERFFRADTRYGFRFREPFGPIPLDFEGFRLTEKGEGFDQIIDESLDYLSIQNNHFSLWQGDASLLYQFNRRDSASGNPQLPIKETRTTMHSANLTTNHFFGSRDQVQFRNFFSFFKQLEYPARQDIRMTPDLLWDLTDSLTWFSYSNLTISFVEGDNLRNQATRIGFNHRLYQSLFTELDIHGNQSQTTAGLSDRSYGGGGNVSYRKRIPFGSFALRYRAVYNINERYSMAPQIPVYGEAHTLIGFIPEELRFDNVITATVKVFNETRSRIFIEGLDYQLTVVGLKTRIQRLATSDIRSGETVLVDYSFATTGTFKYSLFDQIYEASMNVFSYLNFYIRFRNAPQQLISGTPIQPLNSVRNQFYRVRCRIPIREFAIEGDGEYEDHQEVISPFWRVSSSITFRIPMPFSSSFTLRGRRLLVDYLKSIEDVDLIGGSARLESRPWFGARLSAETIYTEDTGGTIPRRDWFGILRAEWRIRQLILRVETDFRREQQPDFERDRFTVTTELRREF